MHTIDDTLLRDFKDHELLHHQLPAETSEREIMSDNISAFIQLAPPVSR